MLLHFSLIDTRIIGSSCVPNHADSRCAISLMPTYIIPGYKCPFCKSVVCKEIDKEYYPIFCPYCDVPMKRRHFEKKSDTISSEDAVVSDCFPDCLNESQNINDTEENGMDYVILTDSDDENDEVLNEMVVKIRKIAISRVPYEESEASVLDATLKLEDVSLSIKDKNTKDTPIKKRKRVRVKRNSSEDEEQEEEEEQSDEDYT